MPGPYGVLGGTDAASLIQQQDDGTWKPVARGKLEDLRPIAQTLNEAEAELNALPIDWNRRKEAIYEATLRTLHRDALTVLSDRLWTDGKGYYRDGGPEGRRYTAWGAEYLQGKEWL